MAISGTGGSYNKACDDVASMAKELVGLEADLRESRAREEKLREALEAIASILGLAKPAPPELAHSIARSALADGPSPSVPVEDSER